jgi:hypothetical protein
MGKAADFTGGARAATLATRVSFIFELAGKF